MACSACRAAVNPSLQPVDLAQRYNAVLCLKISSRDPVAGTVTLDVTDVAAGRFEPKQITLSRSDAVPEDAVTFLRDGQPIVAWVGEKARGKQQNVLFYTGSGAWAQAKLGADPSKWEWTAVLDSQGDDSLFATFNGAEERLVEMMRDYAVGRLFFPATPLVKFTAAKPVVKLSAPIRGVALVDMNADGRPDLFACSSAGNRMLIQASDGSFGDRTGAMGLNGLASVSCSFADINGDGTIDLLADDRLLLQRDGKFATAELPKPDDAKVISSAFVEINGDGYPDVLIATTNGLRALLSSGFGDTRFTDVTERLGLDAKSIGVTTGGYFAPGDLDGDGRLDLFLAAGRGLLLMQDRSGKFVPKPPGASFEFNAEAPTGAGCFGALWQADRLSLIVPQQGEHRLIVHEDGKFRDVYVFTNELTEGSEGQVSTLAEDLDADGHVDVYTGVRDSEQTNVYYTNRGYGSYTRPEKYQREILPEGAHQHGAWGLAAGDINGDGANDMLLGGADGSLWLLINDSLARRSGKDLLKYHEKKAKATRILTVQLTGPRGVLNATLRLEDEKGQILAVRQNGTNVNVGSSSPLEFNLAIRDAGKYTLVARYSDGTTTRQAIEVKADDPQRRQITLPAGK